MYQKIKIASLAVLCIVPHFMYCDIELESPTHQQNVQPRMTRTQAVLLTALGVTLVAATILASYKLFKDISQQSERIKELNKALVLQGVLPSTVQYSGGMTMAADGRMRPEIIYLASEPLVDEVRVDLLVSDLLYFKGLNKMATYVRATAGAAVGMFLACVGLAQLSQDEASLEPASK